MPRISKKPRVRNGFLARGIESLSRSEAFHKSGRWAKKPKEWKAIPKTQRPNPNAPKVKPLGGKVESTRVVKPRRTPKVYPVDAPKKRLPSRKSHHHTPKVRKSLNSGTVVIILSGKFRGKRVVVLKALPSGLLLVTGPFQVNGVPLRRVNPAYVIATTTKLDLSGFTLDAKFNDAYFAKSKSKEKKKAQSEDQYFSTEKKKKEIKPERKEDQKIVDKALIEIVDKTEHLRAYLSARFSLTRHQYPHLLKF